MLRGGEVKAKSSYMQVKFIFDQPKIVCYNLMIFYISPLVTTKKIPTEVTHKKRQRNQNLSIKFFLKRQKRTKQTQKETQRRTAREKKRDKITTRETENS